MSEPSLIGRTIHHFEILSQLGQGGMAVVYKAHQTDLNRMIALKILPPAMTFDKSYIARFQQEARAAAGLEHNHIVPIYEIGNAEGFYYIAMKRARR
jgi:eukaryotic-like serine/threonine-protein kinase